ncbi:MAG: F0F1 ATP synthase subunit B [Candidatus Coatesbacteria bacterium]|nr:MAG: F0F1 ATP synthase subunit B [Candidatus Coatesbacteria bacterium]
MIEFDPALFLYQLAAFSIFAVLFYLLAARRIVGVLEARQRKIEDDLAEGELARSEAEKLRERYADKMAEVERDVADIVRKAHEEADERRAQLVADAEREADRIIERGEETIAEEVRDVKTELRGEVADLAVMIARRVLDETRTDERERELAYKFLEEVEAMEPFEEEVG